MTDRKRHGKTLALIATFALVLPVLALSISLQADATETIVVDPSGNGDYRTIQEAVDAATD
ncbi:MAG: hypothetical protein KAT70_06980, partial [Thermoplasmata archaeon]|nr:hypothetical protein [Thermoplasmata archaeon]